MDFKDRRIWYGVAVVIVVLTIIGYATGWSNGAPAPAPQYAAPPCYEDRSYRVPPTRGTSLGCARPRRSLSSRPLAIWRRRNRVGATLDQVCS